MTDGPIRELTSLEYVVLGLVSMEPQSGYSIINTFESGMFHWSASPGSIYPMLKRLENQHILTSELEAIHELRPRKMYYITSQGEKFLDEWLRRPLTKRDVAQERDIMLMKFLFAEKRLSRQEVFDWLENYEQETEAYLTLLEIQRDPGRDDWPLHQGLVIEADFMELNMQLEWIRVARRRLLEAEVTSSES
jgi:PadR family transcriptional regulator PadR